MSDPIPRLLEAIQATKEDAPNLHRMECREVEDAYMLAYGGRAECSCGLPSSVLRRCAEDRVLVEWYQGWQETFRGPIPEGHTEEGALHFRMASEFVLNRLLASYGITEEET